MKDLVIISLIALTLYIVFGPRHYRPDIVGISRADASEVVRADGSIPALIPEGSMIVVGGGGKGESDAVVTGTFNLEGTVQTVPTVM